MDEDQDKFMDRVGDLQEEIRELRRQAELPRKRRGQRSEESQNYPDLPIDPCFIRPLFDKGLFFYK